MFCVKLPVKTVVNLFLKQLPLCSESDASHWLYPVSNLQIVNILIFHRFPKLSIPNFKLKT